MEFSIKIKSKDGKKHYDFYYNTNDDYVFIENEDMEGIGIIPEQLFNHIDKWFRENL